MKKQIIDEVLKTKILTWLIKDVKLLKSMNDDHLLTLMENLPKYCQTGVLFADLINRLAGREDVIKGINRKPPTENMS